jgi:hypothetical protein
MHNFQPQRARCLKRYTILHKLLFGLPGKIQEWSFSLFFRMKIWLSQIVLVLFTRRFLGPGWHDLFCAASVHSENIFLFAGVVGDAKRSALAPSKES